MSAAHLPARADLVTQFAAIGWPATAASELADLHLELIKTRQAAERLAESNDALRAVLPADATGHGLDTAPATAATPRGGLPTLPLWRLCALALVACLLLLTGCGGGGDTECIDSNTVQADAAPFILPCADEEPRTTPPRPLCAKPELCK